MVGSFGKEIGVRSEILPGLQSSLALWSLNSDSELLYAADSAGTGINGASRRYGMEWNNHMLISRNLLFDADLAWTHARYAHEGENGQSGDRIRNAVGKVASIELSAHCLGAWSGDIKLLYIGGYPLSQDGRLRAPSSTVTNVRIQRQLGRHAALSLDVLNLFDRRYFDIAYEQDYRVTPTAGAQRHHRAPGRTSCSQGHLAADAVKSLSRSFNLIKRKPTPQGAGFCWPDRPEQSCRFTNRNPHRRRRKLRCR